MTWEMVLERMDEIKHESSSLATTYLHGEDITVSFGRLREGCNFEYGFHGHRWRVIDGHNREMFNVFWLDFDGTVWSLKVWDENITVREYNDIKALFDRWDAEDRAPERGGDPGALLEVGV